MKYMNNNNIFSETEIISINEAVKLQIKRDIDQAKIHLSDHVDPKGEVLFLEKSCEYCQVYIKEKRIL
jgi:hypothetical protein